MSNGPDVAAPSAVRAVGARNIDAPIPDHNPAMYPYLELVLDSVAANADQGSSDPAIAAEQATAEESEV